MDRLSVWGKVKKSGKISLGKGWKNREEREWKGWEPVDKHLGPAAMPPSCLVIADHLSARSLSVTWIHWYVSNVASKKGVGTQHTDFTSCQNAAFSNEFFLWRAGYVLEGLVLTEKMWFLPLISYWEVVKHILIFCGYCFWSAWFALWCKNIHCG